MAIKCKPLKVVFHGFLKTTLKAWKNIYYILQNMYKHILVPFQGFSKLIPLLIFQADASMNTWIMYRLINGWMNG